jgi:acetate kinase
MNYEVKHRISLGQGNRDNKVFKDLKVLITLKDLKTLNPLKNPFNYLITKFIF